MPRRFVLKKVFIFAPLLIFFLAVVNVVIFQGGLFVKKVGMIPQRGITNRVRLVAETPKGPMQNKNIAAKNLSIRSRTSDTLFKKGTPIDVSCVIQNNSETNVAGFRSLIRIPGEEISSVKTKVLAPNREITLNGSFTPQETGVFIVACRADIDGQILEADENDNHKIAAIYAL